MPRDHDSADVREDWALRIAPDRPTYECPTCGQKAMQFHTSLADCPEREDFFHCQACGSSWEI